MKQILLELDDETAARLEAVAPARGRRRSDFIRAAIRRALLAIDERATEAAYLRQPDNEPAYFDAAAWEAHEAPAEYRNVLFVARKGSWNRTKKFGYDVVNVRPGADGKGAKVTPFLTGFLDEKEQKFSGRPAYILQMPDGALLVSDEQLGAIYRISYSGDSAKKK